MASSGGVWGIDIGQCALKALRCTLAEDGQTVVADAFDYIEYPKILSQPEAEPEELVREALAQFMSRNDVRRDKVAISVSGQSGLARFIKLPPVEAKKIPDIVKYEARQQIPFPLEEVIWDYQQLKGGSEEEGFALETEVGLFAMKRDQVFKAIRPFDRAEMELDIIQLSPLCIYNVVCHDFLTKLPSVEDYDPEDPPESLVVISLGTDTTDLVVTNGFRVWQRSIPLGGNHFTRALSKDLKLTFAKAEHLKRHAKEAEDPKRVFQAMRPVFNDLVTEVQRSISYFQSIDRKAKIGKVIALGNAMKMPGLQQYLARNLGFDVLDVTNFPNLSGQPVVGAPAFRENVLSFPVCYGLCLQGLGRGALSTNLVPRELLVQRMIRQKKPWAIAAVSLLLLGLSFNFFFLNRAWQSVNVNHPTFVSAFGTVSSVISLETSNKTTDEELVKDSEYFKKLGDEVVGNADRRLQWPELLSAITLVLPHDDPPGTIFTLSQRPLDQRRDIHIQKIESQLFENVGLWFNEAVKKKYLEDQRARKGLASPAEEEEAEAEAPLDPTAAAPADATAAADPAAAEGDGAFAPPEGPGWVIELQGYHDFSIDGRNQGAQYVRETLIAGLEDLEIDLPIGPGETKTQRFKMKDLGILYPVMVRDSGQPKPIQIPNPEYVPDETNTAGDDAFGRREAGTAPSTNKQFYDVERFYFTVQFCWQPNTVTSRLEELKKKEAEASLQGTQNADDQVAVGGT